MVQSSLVKQDLKGKVVIITGASSGIGEATSLEIAKYGATVILAARRENRLKTLAEKINSEGGNAIAVKTDLTDYKQIKNLVHVTYKKFKKIDILINNAGWGSYNWYENLSRVDLRNQYEVNVIGLAELTRLVVPIMKRARSGHVINMSSYGSRISVPLLAVYTSTKYAVEGLSDGLRRELSVWGIKVTRVHPSSVTGTEFNKKASKRGGVKYTSIPIGRITRERLAKEIVELIKHPKNELFISKLYDIPIFINRHFPAFIDFISKIWVYKKRRNELKD